MDIIYLFLLIIFFHLISSETTDENCTVPIQGDAATKDFPHTEPYTFNDTFEVIELENSTDAICLDGTGYKFYFHRGSGSGIDKFIIDWQGSAFCGADGYNILDSCYNRTLTQYGSSNSVGDNGTTIVTPNAWGYFSSLETFNPVFYNWNKVFILSCDGSNHQGYLKDPIEYNGITMWIRGFNNTLSTLEYLKEKYRLFDASEVILSGGSSGGTASYVWMSYLQNYFPSTVKLMGVPDAGFFLDTYDKEAGCHLYRYLIKQLAVFSQSQNKTLYRSCRFFGTDEIWKCLIPQYILRDINFPVFLINSQVDYEQLSNVGGVECIMENGGPTSCKKKDKENIVLIREYFLARIFEIKKLKPQWGFWTRTCFEHTYQFTWAFYGHTMDVFNAETQKHASLREALYEWYNGGNIREKSISSYIDLIDWEHNPFCHF